MSLRVFHGSLDLSHGCVGSGFPGCRGSGKHPQPLLRSPALCGAALVSMGGARLGSGVHGVPWCMGRRVHGVPRVGGEACGHVQPPPEPGHSQGKRCRRVAQKAVFPKSCCGGVTSPLQGQPGIPEQSRRDPLSQGNAEFGADSKTSLGSISPGRALSAAFSCWVSARPSPPSCLAGG